MSGNPRFVWTRHSALRLAQRGLTAEQVEALILEWHLAREPNEGDADWRLDGGRFVVVYDYPAGQDLGTVRVVSVWLKRRR